MQELEGQIWRQRGHTLPSAQGHGLPITADHVCALCGPDSEVITGEGEALFKDEKCGGMRDELLVQADSGW